MVVLMVPEKVLPMLTHILISQPVLVLGLGWCQVPMQQQYVRVVGMCAIAMIRLYGQYHLASRHLFLAVMRSMHPMTMETAMLVLHQAVAMIWVVWAVVVVFSRLDSPVVWPMAALTLCLIKSTLVITKQVERTGLFVVATDGRSDITGTCYTRAWADREWAIKPSQLASAMASET